MSLPVSFLIVGLGNEEPNLAQTRHNAGFILIDFLAHNIALSNYCLLQPNTTETSSVINPDGTLKYGVPTFVLDNKVHAFILDQVYEVESGKGRKSIRVVLAKPITGVNFSGESVALLLKKYPLENQSKQLIVCFDDITQMQGAIAISEGVAVTKHKGIENIIKSIPNDDHFIKLKLGIGRPEKSQTLDYYVLQEFSRETKEIDMFGHALDLSAQAMNFYFSSMDVHETKKKFCNSKKLPAKLQHMSGLVFPIRKIVPGNN